MGGGDRDPDTVAAYYMFVNHGWPPSKYAALPYRERVLLWEFIQREIASRPKSR